ncbi:general stress protein [Duganella sp. FT80W]|uniref:General stress protein n=1 Tax=Duganella guangzhouensis TaxID=2666084 RepID=A0A6I2KZE1_9BURK|nr:pyridoxamine 5'-phosphate oxidase family protein [Duganella guangzhouensis]MRW89379.1 general stress protein [Duganella guangzhouensis]
MPLYSQDQINAIAARIKDVRFGMFTTLGDDYVPSSRPLAAQRIDNEGNLWFLVSDEAPFVEDVRQHPDVNVSFANPEQQIYLSLTGLAYLVRDSPHPTMLRVKIQTAEYWDASTSKMQQLVLLARSALSGRAPVEMGRHTTICL